MRLATVVSALSLTPLNPMPEREPEVDVSGGHASDLLSDVLANAPQGGVLVTIQVHLNVIAVCVHAGLVAVVYSSGLRPDAAVVEKASEQDLALYTTEMSTFDLVGRLYELGVRGACR